MHRQLQHRHRFISAMHCKQLCSAWYTSNHICQGTQLLSQHSHPWMWPTPPSNKTNRELYLMSSLSGTLPSASSAKAILIQPSSEAAKKLVADLELTPLEANPVFFPTSSIPWEKEAHGEDQHPLTEQKFHAIPKQSSLPLMYSQVSISALPLLAQHAPPWQSGHIPYLYFAYWDSKPLALSSLETLFVHPKSCSRSWTEPICYGLWLGRLTWIQLVWI